MCLRREGIGSLGQARGSEGVLGMRIVFGLLSVFVFGFLPAHADTTIDLTKPTQNQTSTAKELNRLFSLLTKAPNETEARAIEKTIWQSWMALPAVPVRKLVKEAMEARRWYDFAKAKGILDKVVKLAPDYAEGWNQRAFILFLQERFDESLSDLEKALELEPRHFGAMAGQARILMRQGRFATGQELLKRAVKIHPFLRERSMIVETTEQEL